MDALKKMRGMPATQENILAYQKECGYLRDLCEDYIVSRRNPLTPDGKERKRMVIDVWEGMSNVNAASFQAALESADPEKKLSDDRAEAMRMMSDIQAIRETLPDIDCGSCGSPTCAAFAEDVVRGEACVDDCTVIMRMLFQKSIEMRKDASKNKDENKD